MSAVLDQHGKPMRLVGAITTTTQDNTKVKPLKVCSCSSNVLIGIAEYMVTEMKRNPFSEKSRKITDANAYDIAKEMKTWNALPWYAKIGGPPDYASINVGRKMTAYTIWAEQVKPHGPWDHKPILKERLIQLDALNKGWQRYGNEDYYYDIWSNIHYGYVGVACGFGADELLGGAGLAQAASDIKGSLGEWQLPSVQHHPENGAWANTFDDIPDHISIKLGIDLYARVKPAALTSAILLKLISSVPIPWGSGKNFAKRLHECPK